jgi:hypothetical protein
MTNRTLIHLLLAPVALAFMNGPALAGQAASARAKTPETSKVADFDPTALAKLAVLVVGNEKSREEQSGHARLVEDVFLETLLAKGHTIAARSDVESVFKEQRFQNSGRTEEMAANIGKLLNVPAVLVIRITEDSTESTRQSTILGRASIGARLVDVQTGAIVWNGKHSETAPLTIRVNSGVVLKAATVLAEAFPEKTAANAFLTPKPIGPNSLPKLAVIMVGTANRGRLSAGQRDSDPQTDQQRQVEDTFVQVLVDKGYRLVSRSDVQALLKEQQFQNSGLTEDNAVAVGKFLNVPAVLLVKVTDFGADSHHVRGVNRDGFISRASLGARLVDVGRGEIWWAHGQWMSREIASRGDANKLLDIVAKDVVDFFPPEPDSTKTLLSRAAALERMGQMTEAMNYYRFISQNHAGTADAKKADARLKTLMAKRPASSR